MKVIFKSIMMTAAILALAAPAHAARQGGTYDSWSVRCEGEGKAQICEAFQRLTHAKSGMRVMEFAIGFPQAEREVQKNLTAIAPPSAALQMGREMPGRGVIVLPLGIMLPDGVILKIDQSKRYAFEVRYCTAEGCYAYIDLPRATIDHLGRAMNATISFTTLDKKNISLPIDLNGFGGALQAIR